MSRSELITFCFSVLIIINSLYLTVSFYYQHEINELKCQAVERGYAEFIDTNDGKIFIWKQND